MTQDEYAEYILLGCVDSFIINIDKHMYKLTDDDIDWIYYLNKTLLRALQLRGVL